MVIFHFALSAYANYWNSRMLTKKVVNQEEGKKTSVLRQRILI